MNTNKERKRLGRPPIDPEVKRARQKIANANRHVTSISFPTEFVAREFQELIGDGNRTTTILAALYLWRGLKPGDLDEKIKSSLQDTQFLNGVILRIKEELKEAL